MKKFFAFSSLSVLLFLPPTAHATLKYWDINGTVAGAGGATPAGNWSTSSANWSTDSTGASTTAAWSGTTDTAVFSAGTDATGTFTVTLPSAITCASVTVEEGTVISSATSAALTIGGATIANGTTLSYSASGGITGTGNITLNGGTFRNSNPGVGSTFLTSNLKFVLGTGGGHLSQTGGASAISIYTGLISGTGPLTIDGNGIFRLTTTAATYTGATTINGILQVSTTANVLPSTTALTINSGGTVNVQNTLTVGSLSGAGSVTGAGVHPLVVGGDNTSTTFSGTIASSGTIGLTKQGSGTLTLTGANANTGTDTLTAGTLTVIGAAAKLCGPVCDLAVNGGTLNLFNPAQTIENLSGSGGTIYLGPGHTLTSVAVASANNSSVITGPGNFTYNTSGFVQTLNGVSTYIGNTTIAKGTLALGASGSINNTASISIAAGATFDVSLKTSPYTLGASTTLIASGTGVNIGTTAAVINGPASGTVNLGAQPIWLTFTPTVFTGDTAHPSIGVAQGALAFNNNQLVVNNAGGTPLSAGLYNAIQVSDGVNGTINGTPNVPVVVYGSGLDPVGNGMGCVATASVSGSDVIVTVAPASIATTITLPASPASVAYAQGSITATVAPVPNSGVVQFFANGAPIGGAVAVDTGTGLAAYPYGNLPAGTYNITAIFSGSADNQFSTSAAAAVSQTVTPAPLTVTANSPSTPYSTLYSPLIGSTQFTSSGLQNGETIGSVTLTVSGGQTTNTVAGNYTLTPSATTGGTFNPANYTITYAAGTLTVAPVALTITASAQSKTYGQTTAFGSGSTLFTVTPTTFVNGQTAASLTVTLACSGGTANSPVSGSPYAITPSSPVATGTNFFPANYTITYANGNLTVNPLPAILTGTRPFDGTANAAAGILSVANTVAGDGPLTVTGTSGTLASSAVGTQSFTSFGDLGLSGTGSANYSVASASSSVTITSGPYLIVSSTLDHLGNIVVCWQSTPGDAYTVLTNTGVGNGTWMDVGGASTPPSPVTASGTTTCVTIPGVNANPQGFVLIKH